MARILYAGADIREHPALPDDDWTPDRRETHLLRTDVVRPLSVDPNVWARPPEPDAPTIEDPLAWVPPDDVVQRAMASLGTSSGRWVAIVIGVVAEDPREEETVGRSIGSEFCTVRCEPRSRPPAGSRFRYRATRRESSARRGLRG